MITKTNSLRGLALAGALAMISAEQSAKAIVIFDVVDANTYTLTLQGVSFSSSANVIQWAPAPVNQHNGFASGGGYLDGALYTSAPGGGTLTGGFIGTPFGATGLADGGVVTVTNITTVDLTTLTLPAAPIAVTSGHAPGVITGDATLVFTPVPEPSSTAILALGGCALLLRRRRA